MTRATRVTAAVEIALVAIPASAFIAATGIMATPLTFTRFATRHPGMLATWWGGLLGLVALWKVLFDRSEDKAEPFGPRWRVFIILGVLAGFASTTAALIRAPVPFEPGAYVVFTWMAVGVHQLPYVVRRLRGGESTP